MSDHKDDDKTDKVDEHMAGKIPASGWYLALAVVAALLAIAGLSR